MKAILTFNLPDDNQEYACANKGTQLSSIIWNLDQWLREQVKYHDELTEEQVNTYEGMRDKLRELMSDEGMNFDDEVFI